MREDSGGFVVPAGVESAAMVANAPALRDRKLDLDELQRLARTFDGIGDEIGGARYPAVAFVRWLADEFAATGRRPAPRDEAA